MGCAVSFEEDINKAYELQEKGRFSEAKRLCAKVLAVDPNNPVVLNSLGVIKYKQKRYSEAVEFIKKAIEIAPCASFYRNMGHIYKDTDNFNESLYWYGESIQLEPENFDSWFCLGWSLQKLEKFDDAIIAYNKALSIDKTSFHAYHNLGNIYNCNKNDPYTAIEYYEKIIEYYPEHLNAKTYLALVYNKTKNYKEGWKYFENRLSKRICTLSKDLFVHEFLKKKPFWDGSSLENKTLFIHYEAGLGDVIMFARYLPLLKQKWPSAKILLKAQKGLIELFRDSDLGVEVINNDTPLEDIVFDTHIMLMSLPYLLGLNSEADIPYPEGYLKTNFQKVQEYKEKYFNNDKLKIGIKWQGNIAFETTRTVPFESFKKLFGLKNTQFYSLQKDEGSEQLENAKNHNIIDLSQTFNDFTDTAAAVENLDLVICNDTSVAHLAGAMDKKCWILLPYVQDWRWTTDLSYSAWYNSVKLFKQSIPDDWNGVMDEIYQELQKYIFK